MTKHILVVDDNSRMSQDFESPPHPDFPSHVDVCITSPPYKDSDGYSLSNIDDVARILNKHLHGPLWLNFGDLADQMDRAHETAWLLQSQGFKWVKTIIWAKSLQGKGQYTPLRGERTFDTRHEYIYLLVPKAHFENFKLDRYIDGDPYTDISNIKRWKSGREMKCPGTIWFIPYETVTGSGRKDLNSKTGKIGHGKHPHEFPLALPRKCLLHTHLPKNGWVLDPYGGSGTVALAAKNLGYNSLTYEKDLNMVPVIQARVSGIVVIK